MKFLFFKSLFILQKYSRFTLVSDVLYGFNIFLGYTLFKAIKMLATFPVLYVTFFYLFCFIFSSLYLLILHAYLAPLPRALPLLFSIS